MPDPIIALVELADELGAHKSVMFKIAKRLGITPTKHKDPDRRNQFVSFISKAEADLIRVEYSKLGSSDSTELSPGTGLFYLLQLEPNLDPGRFKVGFTTDLTSRLRHHRCSAPFATCAHTWPCHRAWERAAIDCVTAGTTQLHTEIFRSESLEPVVERATRFFEVMPSVEYVEEPEEE